ncbi:MAG: PPOX class F420-dependent oxidoreductase [Microbacteriaceae bacterium]
MTTTIPAEYLDLLEQPNFAVLGTVRPDDTVQVNPMWFEYDGSQIKFTHTTKRAKFRNLKHNPAMSMLVVDPKDPLRYLEVRGKLVEATPDPTGSFYVRLGKRYGNAGQEPPDDKADRVILVMSIDTVAIK